MLIPYTKPSITELEIEFATDAATNGWGKNCYDYIVKFEKEFGEYIGSKFCIATSSCTGALTLGLKALGIDQNDEIILADTNWIATASPIVHLGAKPVFVDILPDSWCIDPQKAEEKITERTKAIIATHLYGNLCNMDELLELGQKYNIKIIEDSAEALGSVYKGRQAGSMGVFSTFSFHGTKTLTTGEGGMFVTNDQSVFDKALTLSNHGRKSTQPKQFWSEECGFKFKMSNIQAAIGCGQILRIQELTQRKRDIFAYYCDALKEYQCVTLNPEPANCVNVVWMPTVVFSEKCKTTREILQQKFNENSIDARVFFWPLSSLPMFDSIIENKNSYSIPSRAINLPSYHDMSEQDLAKVVRCLKEVIV